MARNAYVDRGAGHGAIGLEQAERRSVTASAVIDSSTPVGPVRVMPAERLLPLTVKVAGPPAVPVIAVPRLSVRR